MTFPKARLVVSLCLFIAWLGYLGFLVYERYTIILPRPQFAIAQAIVYAEVKDDAGGPQATINVTEIAWCENVTDRASLEKDLDLPEIMSCGTEQGFRGAGSYVIPLIKRHGRFQIAAVRMPDHSKRSYSHGTLEIIDAGKKPEKVLERLVKYTQEKPLHAKGLLEPLMAPIVECLLARALMPQAEPWQCRVASIELPSRLPIGDAQRLHGELTQLGAKVQLRVEELRIHPLTSQTRAQVDEIVAARKPDPIKNE